MPPRPRDRPDVSQAGDPARGEQGNKPVRGMSRVTDGVDGVHGSGLPRAPSNAQTRNANDAPEAPRHVTEVSLVTDALASAARRLSGRTSPRLPRPGANAPSLL